MQTATTLPILQTANDTSTYYIGLQPKIAGLTNAQYVNQNISFNPATNTLTLGVNVVLPTNALRGSAIIAGSITGNLIGVGTLTGNLIANNTITGNAIATPADIFDDAFLFGGM